MIAQKLMKNAGPYWRPKGLSVLVHAFCDWNNWISKLSPDSSTKGCRTWIKLEKLHRARWGLAEIGRARRSSLKLSGTRWSLLNIGSTRPRSTKLSDKGGAKQHRESIDENRKNSAKLGGVWWITELFRRMVGAYARQKSSRDQLNLTDPSDAYWNSTELSYVWWSLAELGKVCQSMAELDLAMKRSTELTGGGSLELVACEVTALIYVYLLYFVHTILLFTSFKIIFTSSFLVRPIFHHFHDGSTQGFFNHFPTPCAKKCTDGSINF